MHNIRIGRKSCRVAVDWQEVGLSTLSRLGEAADELPPAVKAYYRTKIGQEEEVVADASELIDFERAVLSALCDAPSEVLHRARRSDIHAICEAILLPILITLASGAIVYPTEGIKKFTSGKLTYHFPSDGEDMLGGTTPLSGASAIEFCEASDIAAAGKWSLAPMLVAILCRPPHEGYDSDKVCARSLMFKKLPSTIYFEALARLHEAHQYLESEYPACYKKSSEEGAWSSVSLWTDRLLYVAGDRPSELPHTHKLPCYDFVRLLDNKIRREAEQWKMRMPIF